MIVSLIFSFKGKEKYINAKFRSFLLKEKKKWKFLSKTKIKIYTCQNWCIYKSKTEDIKVNLKYISLLKLRRLTKKKGSAYKLWSSKEEKKCVFKEFLWKRGW